MKNIGKREKRKLPLPATDGLSQPRFELTEQPAKQRRINSIAGSNRKKLRTDSSQDENESSESTDTDDVSSDDEVNHAEVDRAVERFQKRREKEQEEVSQKQDADKINEAERPKQVIEDKTVVKRPTKYVHVERREEIQVSMLAVRLIVIDQCVLLKEKTNHFQNRSLDRSCP